MPLLPKAGDVTTNLGLVDLGCLDSTSTVTTLTFPTVGLIATLSYSACSIPFP